MLGRSFRCRCSAAHGHIRVTRGVDDNGRGEGRARAELRIGRHSASASAGGAAADPGRTELEGFQRSQRHPNGWQVPNGYSALSGETGLHSPGTGDHATWEAVFAARADVAPAPGFNDCLAWALRLAADPEGPGAATAGHPIRIMGETEFKGLIADHRVK